MIITPWNREATNLLPKGPTAIFMMSDSVTESKFWLLGCDLRVKYSIGPKSHHWLALSLSQSLLFLENVQIGFFKVVTWSRVRCAFGNVSKVTWVNKTDHEAPQSWVAQLLQGYFVSAAQCPVVVLACNLTCNQIPPVFVVGVNKRVPSPPSSSLDLSPLKNCDAFCTSSVECPCHWNCIFGGFRMFDIFLIIKPPPP